MSTEQTSMLTYKGYTAGVVGHAAGLPIRQDAGRADRSRLHLRPGEADPGSQQQRGDRAQSRADPPHCHPPFSQLHSGMPCQLTHRLLIETRGNVLQAHIRRSADGLGSPDEEKPL